MTPRSCPISPWARIIESNLRNSNQCNPVKVDDTLYLVLHASRIFREVASVRTESGMTSEFKNKERSTTGLCTITKFIHSIHWEIIQRGRRYERSKYWRSGYQQSKICRWHSLTCRRSMFLQALLTAVNEKGKPYGIEMNIIKTKSMVISRKTQCLTLVPV